jgi:hypothetical protein
MALKPDRIEAYTDISFFCNTTAERGGIVSHVTGGSGVSMDDANAVVAYSATGSGVKPAGILLNDVVNIDLTRQHINFFKDEVQVGGKVVLLRQGQITTNMLEAVTPTIGADAFCGVSGLLTSTLPTSGVKVGRFLSTKDADGYVKVDINIT